MKTTFLNDDYKLVLDSDGVIRVFRRQTVKISRTKFSNKGVSQGPVTDEKLLHHFEKTPFIKTCYAGGGSWHVDVEAGFSRWIGYKTGKDVSAALKLFFCFDKRVVKKVLRRSRRHRHTYMGRAC